MDKNVWDSVCEFESVVMTDIHKNFSPRRRELGK